MKKLRNSIRNLIKETLENAQSFETVIDSYNVHIIGLDELFKVDRDIIDYDSEFSVVWALDIESRTWGIKSMIPRVNSVRGTINWKIEKEFLEANKLEIIRKNSDHESETYIEGTLTLNSLNKFNNNVWEVDDNDFEVHEGDEIFPTDLTIDFKKMKIEVF